MSSQASDASAQSSGPDPHDIDAKFEMGLSYHQRGMLNLARDVYDNILFRDPNHFDTLHLRGVLAFQSGDAAKAVELISKAISIFPDDAAFYCNLGNAQQMVGDAAAALASYDQAIHLDQAYAGAYFSRGNALKTLQRPGDALASLDKAVALNPHHAESFFSRGNVLQDLERYDDAIASYDQAIALNPGYVDALVGRGIAQTRLNDLEGAIASYDLALSFQPQRADIYVNRGTAFAERKEFDAAIESFQQAIRLQPDFLTPYLNLAHMHTALQQFEAAVENFDHVIRLNPRDGEAHFYRANALFELQRYDAAIAGYDAAASLNPHYAAAHCNRGITLARIGQVEAAIASYDKALAIDPGHIESYSNRGLLQHELMHIDAAMASYDKALAIDPTYIHAQWNKSISLLMRGEYAEGWKLFEARRNPLVDKHLRTFTEPLWVGQAPLANKTILLHSEQGLGDTIQFCRYIKRVAQLGAHVILETDGALVTLMEGVDGVARVIKKGEPLPSFDYQCPLMSLPYAFKTELSSIPSEIPYITALPEDVAYWQGVLGPRTRPRVGLVWNGGLRRDHALAAANARRNVPLQLMATLNMPSVDFVSLQKGREAEAELLAAQAHLWPDGNFRNFTADLVDFSDTAAVVANLDLIISVDTSTAHLAAAMGKPVWLLNRFDTCWRWLQNRTDSPWYPSLRIYRQSVKGDWASVLAQVKSDLAALDFAKLR